MDQASEHSSDMSVAGGQPTGFDGEKGRLGRVGERESPGWKVGNPTSAVGGGNAPMSMQHWMGVSSALWRKGECL